MKTNNSAIVSACEGEGEVVEFEEGEAARSTDTTLLDIHRAVTAYGNARACSAMDAATLKAELMCLIEAALPAGDVGAGWQPISSAPKHTEVLVWREDSGSFIAKLTTPDAVLSQSELEQADFPEDFEEWFSEAYGWQEIEERPAHWQWLPAAPSSIATLPSQAEGQEVQG